MVLQCAEAALAGNVDDCTISPFYHSLGDHLRHDHHRTHVDIEARVKVVDRDVKERFKSKAQCRREDIQRILDDDDREEEENSSSFGSPSQSILSDGRSRAFKTDPFAS